MAMNGSGVRADARVLHVSPRHCQSGINQKESQLHSGNISVLKQLNPEQVEVEIRLAPLDEKLDVSKSDLDEMGRYVVKKSTPRWLWQDKRPS